MRVYFSLFILLFLLAYEGRTQGHDSLFMASAITKLKNSKEYTLKVAYLMPENLYGFRPTPEEMTFGEQLLHICTNLNWLNTAFLAPNSNMDLIENSSKSIKDSIRSVIVKTYDHGISVLEQFPSQQLGDPVKFFAGPLSKLQIINLISDHQTHHRGQLLVYLRLCGVKPPKYVGW